MAQRKVKNNDVAGVPASVKTPPARAIKWVEQDVDLIVEWFCKRDEAGIPITYEAWVTSAHTDIAQRMLEETGLENKQLATKKKAADKLDTMIKDYKDIKMKVEGPGWGIDAGPHKEHDLTSPHGATVKEYISKKCPWFYDFEDVFHDHPGVNPLVIIESGQPPRCDGLAVEETDLGGFSKNDGAAEGPSKGKKEAHSLILVKAKAVDAAIAKHLPPLDEDVTRATFYS